MLEPSLVTLVLVVLEKRRNLSKQCKVGKQKNLGPNSILVMALSYTLQNTRKPKFHGFIVVVLCYSFTFAVYSY